MKNLAVVKSEQKFLYLKFIAFKNLEKWYVSYYTNPHHIISNYDLLKIHKLISPIKEKIIKQDFQNDYDVVAKISFADGKIHIRDERKTGMDLYKLNKGNLLVSKINFHQGALAINQDKNLVCSTHYQPYRFTSDKVIPDFFVKVIRSEQFKNYLNFLRAEGIKNEATYEFISNLQIPLPGLPKQKAILSRYNAKITEAELLEQELANFSDHYQNTLFKRLGIRIIETKKLKNKLHLINFKNVNRWGYHFLSNHEQSEHLLFTKNYQLKNLPELVELNPNTDFSELQKNDEISFLPMECISDIYGEVIEYRAGKISKSKGYTKFQDRDLLWSKITPCMQNGKSCIVTNLKNGFGFGSTEYHVLRNKDNSQLNIKFLYHLLRTKYVLNNATFHFTGSAGQQRVPIEFLSNLNIPLPSLSLQKEIVQTMDRLLANRKIKQSKAKTLREQAQQEFERTVFK